MLGMFRKSKSEEPTPERSSPGWFARLQAGLKKTGSRLEGLFGARRVDETLFADLEEALLAADAGIEASTFLIERLRERARKERIETAEELKQALRSLLEEVLQPLESEAVIGEARPFVIMIAGVNGAGKTTSIGKIASYLRAQGLGVLLAAGDTFRAAAREQLEAWGERNVFTVISQREGDSAAVIFDAITAARARGIDVVLADTAGRLHTQTHLMEELKKVKRVAAKADPAAPHAVWLVLDANTGQHGLAPFSAFADALRLT
ncbi:MAG: signal recognition particle-docking protein FtsY, partial [Burkholderiales bacterium]|nr:signal recognition particle-docking protein FtsY [Burkholderiales bacterium]